MDINLLAQFDYTFNIKGKNFRTHLIKLFATIYKVPDDLIEKISYDVLVSILLLLILMIYKMKVILVEANHVVI